jgi:hypothetical protein
MCAPQVVLIERVNATLTAFPSGWGPLAEVALARFTAFGRFNHTLSPPLSPLVFSGHVARQGIPASSTRAQNPFLTDRQYV